MSRLSFHEILHAPPPRNSRRAIVHEADAPRGASSPVLDTAARLGFGRKLHYSVSEAAAVLDMCQKTLLKHLARGEIRYAIIGRRTKRFRPDDIAKFLDRQSRTEVAPCPSISRKARRTGTMTSSSRVVAFTALQARRAKRAHET